MPARRCGADGNLAALDGGDKFRRALALDGASGLHSALRDVQQPRRLSDRDRRNRGDRIGFGLYVVNREKVSFAGLIVFLADRQICPSVVGALALRQIRQLRRDHGPLARRLFPALAEIVRGELAENAERKDFLPSEIDAIRRALAPVEKVAAKERQGARTDLVETSAKVSQKLEAEKPQRVVNKIGEFAGVSGWTVEKIAQVVEAAALPFYARQADDDQLEKMAVRIRARAVRRCGELLKQFDAKGKRTDREEISGGAPTRFSQREAAEKAGMSKDQQVQAVRVANVPEPEFTRQVESDVPPTITALASSVIPDFPFG